MSDLSGKPLIQLWEGEVGGHQHLVELYGPTIRRIVWVVDGVDVARKTTVSEKVTLDGGEHGRLVVRMSFLGSPRRATVLPPTGTAAVASLAPLGGTDLVPDSGSKAERYTERMLAHPRLYTARETLGAAAGVLVPLLAAALLTLVPWPRIQLPHLPWPDLPSIPVPDLPSIPVPDLPSIPWPDVSVPQWVETVLDAAQYVVPVVIAYVLARAEIRRRRAPQQRPDDARS